MSVGSAKCGDESSPVAPQLAHSLGAHTEVAHLLDILDGEQIVKESYAQMRKFNYWNMSIVQPSVRAESPAM